MGAAPKPPTGGPPSTAERMGVVLPPANPAAEPELQQLLAPAVVHATRFPVLPEPDLATRLEAYNAALPAAIESFGQLRRHLQAVIVACSGSRYPLGPEEDQTRCADLSAEFSLPVASATVATHALLQHLGVRALVLISPYESWLTEAAEQFWRQAGLIVTQVVAVRAGGRTAPYEVEPGELVDQVGRARLASDAVLLFTGTGMSTLPVLPSIGAGNNRILLTSNLCSAWWALTHTAAQAPARSAADLAWSLRRLHTQGAPA